jgi:hypothetical protein
VTSEDFRRLALDLPETSEGAHMGHRDFRVRGKIFATIWPNEAWGMVKLTPEQQKSFVQAEPAVFAPVKGAWGRRGATSVRLEATNVATLRGAILTAWRTVAPNKLVEQEADP